MKTRLKSPLYLQLAENVEGMITAGTLRAGDRVPSVRQLSRQHKVSVPTVVQAYTLLESRRVIEARPKSGFYVRPKQAVGLTEPAMPRRVPAAADLKGFAPLMSVIHDIADPALVPLGGAIPSAELLPLDKLSRITSGILRKTTAAAINYDPTPGCLGLRKELGRRSLDWGCYLEADHFILTNGASEALHLALRAVTRPGDTVIVESPVYYGLLHILSELHLKALAVPASARDGISIEGVELAVKRGKVAAIVVIPNFSNPLGSFMPEENRKALLDLAAARGIPVIEDDIYGDIPHEGPRPRCLKSLDTHDNVILCGSFSKTLAPGFRSGFIASERHRDRLIALKMSINFANTSLQALALAEFLRTGGYDHHLRRLRHTYRGQVGKMREAIAATFPSSTKVSNPAGGFVLWLELPTHVDSREIFQTAREAGISVAPGFLFSPASEFNHCLRISCGFPWSPRIETAVAQLGQIVARRV
ncbi:MAG: PLP-dependent aminotransferase family protein [Rariglobus sp.]